jgi:glycogen debranching enzyme
VHPQSRAGAGRPDGPARQPWLHTLTTCVDGNTTVLSDRSGDVIAGTAHGLYVDDVRVLSHLALTVQGEAPAWVASEAHGATAEFLLSARNLGVPGADPQVEVRRTRRLEGPHLRERLAVTNRGPGPVSCRLELEVAADGNGIAAVKAGHTAAQLVEPRIAPVGATFAFDRHETAVAFDPAPDEVTREGGVVRAVFELEVSPQATATVLLSAEVRRTAASALDADRGSDAALWQGLVVESDDPRLGRAFTAAVDDLRHLLLRDPQAPDDVFAAAGSPWYLTLFGRDSLWTARMMLPFGTELAAGTLRTLARRQGRRFDEETAEAPGKIPHELRRTAYHDPESGLSLPPVYWGTVDATALWVTLLGEAWQWGLPESEVRDLLPALRAAIGWLTGPGQPDDDGLLKYLDTTGTGLANQGWKDSVDAIRWRDGRIADGPIALVEAQAYAVEALDHAARLLGALGEEGALEAEQAAAALRHRVAQRFWVSTDAGEHLAMALDGSGAAVDGLGSNMGHVLGTGTVTGGQAVRVAEALTSAEMLDAFGVRTLGSRNGGFNPIGYHTGSIWTHDTAIAAWGLAREGHRAAAGRVARALLDAGEAFGYRYPELYSGLPLMGRPAPYPASCLPQAWSAASAAVLVTVALGLRPDGSGGLVVTPPSTAPFGAVTVHGLRFHGHPFSVQAGHDGTALVTGLPDEFEVSVGSA